MHPSCLKDSLGFVSLRSSGNTETKAAMKSQLDVCLRLILVNQFSTRDCSAAGVLLFDFSLFLFTNIEEAPGGEGKDPGSPGLEGLD